VTVSSNQIRLERTTIVATTVSYLMYLVNPPAGRLYIVTTNNMFGYKNAYNRGLEDARKQEELKVRQKNEGDNGGSGSFQVNESTANTLKPEIGISETDWGDDCASVISCLTIDTKDATMKGNGFFGTARRRIKQVVEDLSVSSSVSGAAPVPASAASVPRTDKARSAAETIALIEGMIECQEGRLDQLEDKIVANTKQGREKLQQGNKRAGVRAMKKIKMLQFEMENISAAIHTMESQIITLESALNNAKAVAAMKNLNSAPSDQMDQMDISLHTIQENFDFQAKINEILSRPVQGVEMGDEELLAELAVLWVDSFTLAEDPSLAPSSSVDTLATSTSSLVAEESPIAPSRRQARVAGRPRPPRRTRSASTPSSPFLIVD
jgi:hypothetical protein